MRSCPRTAIIQVFGVARVSCDEAIDVITMVTYSPTPRHCICAELTRMADVYFNWDLVNCIRPYGACGDEVRGIESEGISEV